MKPDRTPQISELEALTGRELSIDEVALTRSYEQDGDNEGSVTMQLLSMLGALLSLLLFAVFLFLSGLGDSTVVLGILGIGMLLGGRRFANRGVNTVFQESLGVCLTACGYGMLLFSLEEYIKSFEGFTAVAAVIAALVLLVNTHKLIVLLATVALTNCTALLSYEWFGHLGAHLYVAGMTGLLLYWVEQEALLLTSGDFWNQRYAAIRTGLIVGLLGGAWYLSDFHWWNAMERPPNWYASLVLIPATGYVARKTMHELLPASPRRTSYLVAVLALLAPTTLAPALAAALFVLLLSYRSGYLTGTALGAIGLVYGLGRYYYDLNLSLLTKSGVLSASGLLFLIAYFVFLAKFPADETTD